VSDFHDHFSDSKQIGVEFLLTDLDVAMTFMDIAEVSRCEETIRRNQANARKACASVINLLEKLSPDERQRQVIEAKLALLKARLGEIGH